MGCNRIGRVSPTDWRAGYAPAMDRVRRGELPWTRIDDLHRMILEELLGAAGITSICDEDVDELNRAWHRLDPWPDTVRRTDAAEGTVHHHNAFQRQRVAADQHGQARRTAVGLRDLGGVVPPLQARPAGLPRLRRPARRARRTSSMLVAAHPGDLRAARAAGSEDRVRRPPAGVRPEPASRTGSNDDEFDVTATDFRRPRRPAGA